MAAEIPGEAEIYGWCVSHLVEMLENPEIVITPDMSFAQMGLDSASSAYFIVELEEWLGIELSPELVFEYPTLAALVKHLAQRQG